MTLHLYQIPILLYSNGIYTHSAVFCVVVRTGFFFCFFIGGGERWGGGCLEAVMAYLCEIDHNNNFPWIVRGTQTQKDRTSTQTWRVPGCQLSKKQIINLITTSLYYFQCSWLPQNKLLTHVVQMRLHSLRIASFKFWNLASSIRLFML